MSAEYAWLGLAAAVPIVIIVLVLALRGYNVRAILDDVIAATSPSRRGASAVAFL